LTVHTALRHALDRRELSVLYQPIHRLDDLGVVGAEALLRWNPATGPVSPAEFIPAAEETGLILPIGEWVLREACEGLASWQASGGGALWMAVNLSSHQLVDPALAALVARTLTTTGIDPATLHLEITESAAMSDVERTIETLQELRRLGTELAVDDFGTGYSSLSYLKRLPLDMLKIDRSFVAGVPDDAHAVAIAQAVVALARSLGLVTLAEGIETPEQLDALRRMGVDYAQGYHLGRPMPLDRLPVPAQEQRVPSAGGWASRR
jgi:EAL domain-containing protein (putative c-di-GMP-specific phosphodiesterase class I)